MRKYFSFKDFILIQVVLVFGLIFFNYSPLQAENFTVSFTGIQQWSNENIYPGTHTFVIKDIPGTQFFAEWLQNNNWIDTDSNANGSFNAEVTLTFSNSDVGNTIYIQADMKRTSDHNWDHSVGWTLYVQAPPFINITYPTASGLIFHPDDQVNIQWNTNISGNVQIKLIEEPYSDSTTRTLEDSISASTGSFQWGVPDDLSEDKQYKIWIQSLNDNSIQDWSDYTFSTLVKQMGRIFAEKSRG